jgi:hypothetical protein
MVKIALNKRFVIYKMRFYLFHTAQIGIQVAASDFYVKGGVAAKSW